MARRSLVVSVVGGAVTARCWAARVGSISPACRACSWRCRALRLALLALRRRLDADAVAAPQPALPVPVLSALIEEGPFGPLPRIAPDGRRPFLAYARPFNLDDQRPRIALLVLGIGPADRSDARQRSACRARSACISRPMPRICRAGSSGRGAPGMRSCSICRWSRPTIPPATQVRNTLLASNSTEENLKRLDWLLARATGYIALPAAAPGSPPARAPLRSWTCWRGAAWRWSRSAEPSSRRPRPPSGCPTPARRPRSTRSHRRPSIDLRVGWPRGGGAQDRQRLRRRAGLSGIAGALAAVGGDPRGRRAWSWRRSAPW